MDLVASASRPLKVKEIPYTFRNRLSGESKLDSRVAQEFIILFLEKLFGGFVPIRFLLFAFVGALGLIVHLAVLGIMVDVLDQGFREGQTMAVLTAMTFNFVLNNRLTYRDMRLKGAAFIKGLFTFYARSEELRVGKECGGTVRLRV